MDVDVLLASAFAFEHVCCQFVAEIANIYPRFCLVQRLKCFYSFYSTKLASISSPICLHSSCPPMSLSEDEVCKPGRRMYPCLPSVDCSCGDVYIGSPRDSLLLQRAGLKSFLLVHMRRKKDITLGRNHCITKQSWLCVHRTAEYPHRWTERQQNRVSTFVVSSIVRNLVLRWILEKQLCDDPLSEQPWS